MNKPKFLIGAFCLLAVVSATPTSADVYGTEITEDPGTVRGIKVVTRSAGSTAIAPAQQQSSGGQEFTLRRGESIKSELEIWAERSGWVIDWQLSNSWIVPNGITFYGDFRSAATAVIHTLAENGIVIRAIVNEANKTMLVQGANVREQ